MWRGCGPREKLRRMGMIHTTGTFIFKTGKTESCTNTVATTLWQWQISPTINKTYKVQVSQTVCSWMRTQCHIRLYCLRSVSRLPWMKVLEKTKNKKNEALQVKSTAKLASRKTVSTRISGSVQLKKMLFVNSWRIYINWRINRVRESRNYILCIWLANKNTDTKISLKTVLPKPTYLKLASWIVQINCISAIMKVWILTTMIVK